MATHAHVRRIALTLPGREEASGRFAFSVLVKGKPPAGDADDPTQTERAATSGVVGGCHRSVARRAVSTQPLRGAGLTVLAVAERTNYPRGAKHRAVRSQQKLTLGCGNRLSLTGRLIGALAKIRAG
jgi:hypothetical protein